MKIRAALQGLRNAPPLPSDPLMVETERVLGKLREIDTLNHLLSSSKDRILAVDTEALRKTLDSIETLQASIRSEAEENNQEM